MDSVNRDLLSGIVRALHRAPLTVADARRHPAAGGVDDVAGFYAWWAKRGALPKAEGMRHPRDRELRALYVGISPIRADTKQRLRGRVVGNHIGSNTGGSTFRFALAALLREERSYRPRLRINSRGRRKYVLSRADNQDLRSWQEKHLRVTWARCQEPWQQGLEAAVIDHFKPPLNYSENSDHTFYETLDSSRAEFRSAAERA